MKTRIPAAIVILLALVLAAACDQGGTGDSNGDKAPVQANWGNAPDIGYTTFDGRSGKLSDHFGKPLVVNFWAAWCPPCKQEMPEFDEIYKKYEGQFDMIAIAMDQRNDPVGFFQAQGFSYTGASAGRDAFQYVPSVIPVTAFIDKNGNLVHRQEGGISGAVFESHLKKIL